MSAYSLLHSPDIIEIAKQYGIQKIHSHSVLSGGSENTNHLISTEKGKFVLTVCEQKTNENARELGYLLEHLAEHGLETSKLERTMANEPIVNWKGKPVMLKVFLVGKTMNDLPMSILEFVGSTMGKLHQIEAPSYLPKKLNYGKEKFHQVGMYAADSPFELWINEIQEYLRPYFSEDLPKALIHADIFYSNIVVSSDENSAYIMDFEEATYYYRIFDIGMTIIGLCSEGKIVNLQKAHSLLKGYQRILPLLDPEKKALQAFTLYAAASMTFWRHRNFRHTNPNRDMYDHYLGLKVLADFVKKVPNDVFLDILD